MGLKQKFKNAAGAIGLVGLLAGGCSDLNKYLGKEEPKEETKKEIVQHNYKSIEPKEESKKDVYCDADLVEKINKLADLDNFAPSNGKYEKINVDGKLVKISYGYCNPENCYDSTDIEIKIPDKNSLYNTTIDKIIYSFEDNGSLIKIELHPCLRVDCDDLVSLNVDRESIKDPEIRKKALEFGYKVLDTLIQSKQKDVQVKQEKIKKAEDTARKAFGVK